MTSTGVTPNLPNIMPRKRGYSTGFIRAVNAASPHHIGVQLGRVCIKKGIPVTDVAEYLGVSRQAVYMWFTGASNPRADTVATLKQLVKTLKLQPNEDSQ